MASRATVAHQTAIPGAPQIVPPERHLFKALLSVNPNYFGTAADTTGRVVTPIAGDTTYERLECVSVDAERGTITAILSIRKPFGFGGGPRSIGSREHLRFYVDHGDGWVDAGCTSFAVHDLVVAVDLFGDCRLPLSHAATVSLPPGRERCRSEIARVRAILSWDVAPTGPDFVPVWGNVTDCDARIQPGRVRLEGIGLDDEGERLVASVRPGTGGTPYVAFWADWEGAGRFSYVGTARMHVDDDGSPENGGLSCAAVLPLDLSPRRRPHSEPRVVRIRAILSDDLAPWTTDPDASTASAERIDTHVRIGPGARERRRPGSRDPGRRSGRQSITTPSAAARRWP
jgi:hypothetical protein